MNQMKVNAESCIGCGACASICPNVFEIDDEHGYAHVVVDQIADDDKESAIDAMEGCPTNAIVEVEESENMEEAA